MAQQTASTSLSDLGVSTLTTLIVLTLTTILVYLSVRRRKGVPPGPPLWPVIGNMTTFLSSDILGELNKLRNRYGDIFGLYIGGELSIFLNGYDVIHDAFVKKGSLFSTRPFLKYKELVFTPNGTIFNNGSSWKKQRSFALASLNEICFKDQGKGIETTVNEEIALLIIKLENTEVPIDPKDCLNSSFSNIIFLIVHGRRIGYENEDFNLILSEVQDEFKRFTKYQVLISCFSFLKNLPFDLLNLKKNAEIGVKVKEYHRKMCAENFDRYVSGSKDCVFDNYLTNVVKDTTLQKLDLRDHFDDRMWNLIHDLMAAGSETGATTLTWTILYLSLNPQIQRNIQEEIDSELNPDQMVCVNDREKLPYVQATVLEGLRIGVPAPLGLPHGVDEEFMFRGHLIPKGAQVYSNLASLMKDPTVFEDPEHFRPERFLSKDLKTLAVPKEFIPFSGGPRSCIGETLAKIELFMYTASLLRKFDIVLDPSTKPTSLLGQLGVTYQPPGFKVQFKIRQGKKS